MVYPSGFTVRYVYTALGYQSEARNDATNALFWRADTMNAELQLTAFTHGNNVATTQVFDANTGRLTGTQAGSGNTVQNAGYVWDNVGNMTQRSDATQALVETFIHDGLNRLTSSEIFGSPAKTVTYNAIGNIVTKSDVGTYTYPTTGSARPHAVSSIAGSVTTSFTYDANGNMLTGNARTLTWTSFNMPATIARGAATVGFTYDPEYNRIKQTTPDGATHYLWDSASGINIEKFIGTGGSTQWSNYVFAGGQMVAVFYERTPGPSATRYFHKDHLGSLAVITDEAGAVSERLAYDSWGKRRHANGADDPGEAITSQANRGYTGHEHLEEVGLVHMNGRIYEPLVARFMSSDPIVQDPFSTQSLNRYSYVMNNPMAHTDPTGFQTADLGPSFGISFGFGSAWDYGYWMSPIPMVNLQGFNPRVETTPSQGVVDNNPLRGNPEGNSFTNYDDSTSKNGIPTTGLRIDICNTPNGRCTPRTALASPQAERPIVNAAPSHGVSLFERNGVPAAELAASMVPGVDNLRVYQESMAQGGWGYVKAPFFAAGAGAEYVLAAATAGGSAVALGYAKAGIKVASKRVGRWMGRNEFDVMSATGRVQEGAGGRTSVIFPSNPNSFKAARPGDVYAEFDVPADALRGPTGNPDWYVIPGPNVNTKIFGSPPTEMPPAACIVCVEIKK